MVLALPLNWTKRAAEAAPDLWTIRQPSVYLETSGATLQAPADTVNDIGSVADVETSDKSHTVEPLTTLEIALPTAVRRWQDSFKSGATLTVWDAAEASEAAL